MRNRIWTELVKRESNLDLKAGRGGLIDIEFAAQFLQLTMGHLYPDLQTTSTVQALSAAGALGLASEDDTVLLADGYRFLRRIEHRLRIVHDRSEHRLPADAAELDLLARRAGYADGKQLRDNVETWSGEIHQAYLRVLGR